MTNINAILCRSLSQYNFARDPYDRKALYMLVKHSHFYRVVPAFETTLTCMLSRQPLNATLTLMALYDERFRISQPLLASLRSNRCSLSTVLSNAMCLYRDIALFSFHHLCYTSITEFAPSIYCPQTSPKFNNITAIDFLHPGGVRVLEHFLRNNLVELSPFVEKEINFLKNGSFGFTCMQ